MSRVCINVIVCTWTCRCNNNCVCERTLTPRQFRRCFTAVPFFLPRHQLSLASSDRCTLFSWWNDFFFLYSISFPQLCRRHTRTGRIKRGGGDARWPEGFIRRQRQDLMANNNVVKRCLAELNEILPPPPTTTMFHFYADSPDPVVIVHTCLYSGPTE